MTLTYDQRVEASLVDIASSLDSIDERCIESCLEHLPARDFDRLRSYLLLIRSAHADITSVLYTEQPAALADAVQRTTWLAPENVALLQLASFRDQFNEVAADALSDSDHAPPHGYQRPEMDS